MLRCEFQHGPRVIVLVDNYDSFTHNLWQLVLACAPEGQEVSVIRNDACAPSTIRELTPSHVVLSPGPGHPRAAGLSLTLPEALPTTPVLGVCLGHQALAQSWGGCVSRSPRPTHGSTALIEHDREPPFESCPSPMDVALYHSLVVEEASLPHDVRVAARTRQGDVMAIRHRFRPHVGVQFHPESFMTPLGPRILRSFLNHDLALR